MRSVDLDDVPYWREMCDTFAELEDSKPPDPETVEHDPPEPEWHRLGRRTAYGWQKRIER